MNRDDAKAQERADPSESFISIRANCRRVSHSASVLIFVRRRPPRARSLHPRPNDASSVHFHFPRVQSVPLNYTLRKQETRGNIRVRGRA